MIDLNKIVYDAVVKPLEDQIASLTAAADVLTRERDAYKNENTTLNNQNGALRLDNTQLSQKVAALEAEIVTLKARIKELEAETPTEPVEDDKIYVGVYHGGTATDDSSKSTFGAYPQIASTYYQTNQASLNIAAETQRINKGISPLLTITTKSGPVTITDIANRTDLGVKFIKAYVDALKVLSEVNPNVPVYATIDHEFEVKLNQKVLVGPTLQDYAKALSYFIAECKARAPKVVTLYWYGYSDTAKISQVLDGLTEAPDMFTLDPYWMKHHPTTNTFMVTVKPKIDWIRANKNYVRLGSPEIGLSEFGADLFFGDDKCSAWMKDLRANLKTLGLKFAVLFNRNSSTFEYMLSAGKTPNALKTFSDEMKK